MLDTTTYKRLVQEAPEAVMVRAVLEQALEAEAVDEVFEDCRDDQYTRTLLFSSLVELMTLVVCRVRRTELVFTDWRALNIFASPEDWTDKFGSASPRTIASALKSMANHVDMHRIKKTKRGPKKPPPKRTSNKRKPNVSTHRVLKTRRRAK